MRAKILSRPILPRQILPRWIDMLSPAVLSAAAIAFLLGFDHPPTHFSEQPRPALHATVSTFSGSRSLNPGARAAAGFKASLVPARDLPQTAGIVETVLICATPHADSPGARPFASGRQPILCTFKPL